MTVLRAKFKLALRYIKRHENIHRQDAIANALCFNIGGKLEELRTCLLTIYVGEKSSGLDGFYTEHLKYGRNDYWPLLAQCVASFLVHGYLPETLMSVVLIIIINDKSGKINSKDNYRPIAIA